MPQTHEFKGLKTPKSAPYERKIEIFHLYTQIIPFLAFLSHITFMS